MKKQWITTVVMIAMVLGLVSGTVLGADLFSELGILDLDANGGINPATGNPWQAGDTYRFVFSSSEVYPSDITSSDTIATYNNWIQGLADASSLRIGTAEGVTWNALVSTASVNARDNTSTNPNTDGDGEGIFLLNGTTRVVDDYVEVWNVGGVNASQNSGIVIDENGDPWNNTDATIWANASYGGTWTGTKNDGTVGSPLATDADVTWGGTPWTDYNHWIYRSNADPSANAGLMYGLSETLTVWTPPAGTLVTIR
jgi:hypothetical protein